MPWRRGGMTSPTTAIWPICPRACQASRVSRCCRRPFPTKRPRARWPSSSSAPTAPVGRRPAVERRPGQPVSRSARSADRRRLEPQYRSAGRKAAQPRQRERPGGRDRAQRQERVHGRGQRGAIGPRQTNARTGQTRRARRIECRHHRFGGHRRRHAGFGGREHQEHRSDDARAGRRHLAGRLSRPAAGFDSAGHDRPGLFRRRRRTGPADAGQPDRRHAVVELQSLHDDQNLSDRDPVWRRHRLLPVSDFAVSRGTGARPRSRRRRGRSRRPGRRGAGRQRHDDDLRPGDDVLRRLRQVPQ